MRVAEAMQPVVHTCRASDPLARAAELMWAHDCGFLPVVDARRRVTGVITDRDVCMAVWTQGRSPHEIEVASTMCRDVAFCRESDSLQETITLLRLLQLRRLPVVDVAGYLVGVLSTTDILRAHRRTPLLIKESDIVHMLEEIARPRFTGAQTREGGARHSAATQPQGSARDSGGLPGPA
ncbi:MAG: CBS domain-containing protein [Deltaproteobacteria bacterium]|nr:CBS domain-containing protein [Deltaproteobacteria bacterium]